MSVPTTIFIDTSIFEEMGYNFEAASIEAFRQIVGTEKFTLLMPDPTIREIRRHIKDKAAAAVKSLEDAARRAPFIRKLENWPLYDTNPLILKNDIERIVTRDYNSFLAQFNLIELGYHGVDLQRIMNLYDWKQPPFSDRKKSEFPDAFAVSSILHHQMSNAGPIAIISKDKDFQSVCNQHTQLMYFPSLATFAEALNRGDQRVENVLRALKHNDDELREAINEQFKELGFYVEADWDGDASDAEIYEFESIDYHVVALGEDTCAVAFNAEVIYTAHVSYDDYDSAVYDGGIAYPIHRISGTAQDKASISGIIKLSISGDESVIQEVQGVQIDQKDFTIASYPDEQY
ncbi:MAG: PIN domain-containing protein [Opitutales bacterium]|nr:PIN domain-containing protein [Opitutales bacterium]